MIPRPVGHVHHKEIFARCSTPLVKETPRPVERIECGLPMLPAGQGTLSCHGGQEVDAGIEALPPRGATVRK